MTNLEAPPSRNTSQAVYITLTSLHDDNVISQLVSLRSATGKLPEPLLASRIPLNISRLFLVLKSKPQNDIFNWNL